MAKKNYKAAIIGVGFIGGADKVSGDALGQLVSNMDGTHYQAFDKHPRVEVVAGSSRDAGRRERFEKRSGAKTYVDWREMIDKEAIDIVSVATYTPVHTEITIACVEKGIPVIYCEKPIATYQSDAEKMVLTCEQAGVLLVINHNRRFNYNFRRLRGAIEDGILGELTSATMQWPNGRLGNVGTHMIDSIRMLLGSEVKAVSATLDLAGKPDCRGPDFSDPGGWGMMRMENGLIVIIDAADYSMIPHSISINGKKSRAIVDGSREVSFEFWENGQKDHWADPHPGATSMDTAVNEIVEWLEEGKTFPYPAREALGTHEAIVAFHASHAHNSRWIELPLKGTDREIAVNSG